MDIAMCYHFVSIIIIFGTSFLCYSILIVLLTLVVFSRLWLIITWISIRLWLIIGLIMLSTRLPIMIYFPFTKLFLCNYYIYSNWWKTCTYFWRITNNSNIFIFNRRFIAMLINIFGIVWRTVKWTFGCCCCSWTCLKYLFRYLYNKFPFLDMKMSWYPEGDLQFGVFRK